MILFYFIFVSFTLFLLLEPSLALFKLVSKEVRSG